MNTISISKYKSNSIKIPFGLMKLVRFEFWPAWVLYFPVYVYGLWLAAKARSLTFFTAANPLMYLGGLIGESKAEILTKIPPQFLPTTFYTAQNVALDIVLQEMSRHQLLFPIIVKPDIGERGRGVAKIYSVSELELYLNQNKGKLVVQSFITYPIELGILYYRFPDGSQSGITSIVSKKFLSITGNGIDTLASLITGQERAQLQLNYLLHKFSQRLNDVVADGHTIVLEPIGNHCRGTTFYDANHLITPQLVKVFDTIASQIDGFDIGRFDLKVPSFDDLYNGSNIQIMELNGVASEPAHIYDPNASLIKAYKALIHHWKLVYQIAIQNKQLGHAYAPFKTVVNELRKNRS